MTNHLSKRAFKALSLEHYFNANKIDELNHIPIDCPHDEQYVLRMLVKKPFVEFQLPKELHWMRSILLLSNANQLRLGINQPFCYVTVRHGVKQPKTNDVWHVDGFSMNITHLPEQNYIWTNVHPTEYVEKAFDFPMDFDPAKHNIHSFFANKIKDEDIKTCLPNILYGMDPYIIHRRPVNIPKDTLRTFVRISYTPIEIMDDNNTGNPLLYMPPYHRDGIKDFRNSLIDYK